MYNINYYLFDLHMLLADIFAGNTYLKLFCPCTLISQYLHLSPSMRERVLKCCSNETCPYTLLYPQRAQKAPWSSRMCVTSTWGDGVTTPACCSPSSPCWGRPSSTGCSCPTSSSTRSSLCMVGVSLVSQRSEFLTSL